MISTTATKKDLIDFLWEWAQSNGDWGKLLVSSIIDSEQALPIAERQLIFDYFLQSIKLNSGLPDLGKIKPKYIPTANKINLLSLSQVKGVNKLAENQVVNFGKNLTIIYGENGTGKTGYCRILKALGFSYDPQQTIYSDITSTKVPQSAIITYTSNDNTNTHLWDNKNYNSDLSSVSVFNNSCVQISLVDGRNLIVSPIGFHLFNLISVELLALNEMLNEAISKRKSKLLWDVKLTLDTPQQKFIRGMNAQSTEQELIALSTFTDEHQENLLNSESELIGLNKGLLEANSKSYKTYIIELNAILVKIKNAKDILSDDKLRTLFKYSVQISNLKGKAKTGIKDIADAKGIDFYNTDEFQNFIRSAEQYIKLLDKPDYPIIENDICIYCRQGLSSIESIELLKNYRALLNDNSEKELYDISVMNTSLLEQIELLDANLFFNCDVFGINDNNEIVQPDELKSYNQKVAYYKDICTQNKIVNETKLDLDFDHYINFFTSKKEYVQIKLDNAINALNDLQNQETLLKNKISELQDRKILNENIDGIRQKITYMQVIERLEKNRNKFSTNSISRKTTEAREELVKQNFIKIFNEELSHLRKSAIKIDIDFGTVKGTSRVQQKIRSNYNLTEILSEGEQKAIALAEYLTELQLDNSESPVIFDDPVNSLDHHIIDDVARRLINLSKNRQVVICTHSILLFNSILYFSKSTTFKALDYKFYNSKNQFDVTGYITEAEEEINKVTEVIKSIRGLINNTPQDRNEQDIASDGYGYLRSAIELFVEHEIFQGTVKRYQKNIALTSFVKVNGALVNAHKDKLNELFERCCGYIKGHSNPVEIHNEPTFAELKEDFNLFIQIRQEFLN